MLAPPEVHSPISVLLVDDQRAIVAGVTALIESAAPSLFIAGCALSRDDALEQAANLQPQVIVLDVELGGTNGLSLIPLFKSCCDAAVVVLTCIAEPATRRRAFNLGAAAFLSKAAHGDDLIAAIRQASRRTQTVE